MSKVLNSISNGLWWTYGHTYDGLLSFWPYTNLVRLTADRFDGVSGSVLELGCGTGNILKAILDSTDVTATGVDLSSSMLGVAKRKLGPYERAGRVKLVKQDLVEFLKRQPDAVYDAMVSVNVLYAIDDQAGLWREIFRVLKPDGKVVITTSVETGSGPIIAEHLEHHSFVTLLKPKLLGVFVIDALINLFGAVGHYAFHNEAALRQSIEGAGGKMTHIVRCYGGSEKGVNILFDVIRA